MIPMEWIWGVVGGLMIGTAASLFLLLNGRIMGASGIISGLIENPGKTAWQEKASFAAGLFILPGIAAFMTGTAATNLTSNFYVIVGGGILVGLGARMANGCTSGHGVCGISRLSVRGIMATVFYLFSGGVAVLLFRHVWGII